MMQTPAPELRERQAALLAPIPGNQPCGIWLRHDSVYQQIAEARREDDPSLPQGIWEQAPKRADWALVEHLCQEALTQRSKDLQITAWLTEAWLRRRGLPGLIDGLQLMTALLEQYWDGLYPRMEQNDAEYRLAPFVWLNKHGAIALGTVQIAAGASPAGRLFTLAEWAVVVRNERTAAPAAQAPKGRGAPSSPDEVTLTRQHFSTAVAMTPASFYKELQIQLHGAAVALDRLAIVLDTCLAEQAPALGNIESRLDECFQALQELAGVPWQDKPEQEDEMESVKELPPVRPLDPAAAPRSREEAYRRLDEVADYLLRTEPHSPVPYLVKRAVAWGNMPLAELLQELLDSESDLKQIYRLLGTRGL
jgi:type VI secretion system protein ImpA